MYTLCCKWKKWKKSCCSVTHQSKLSPLYSCYNELKIFHLPIITRISSLYTISRLSGMCPGVESKWGDVLQVLKPIFASWTSLANSLMSSSRGGFRFVRCRFAFWASGVFVANASSNFGEGKICFALIFTDLLTEQPIKMPLCNKLTCLVTCSGFLIGFITWRKSRYDY